MVTEELLLPVVIELSEMNDESLILCIDDDKKWEAVQNGNKLDCNKNEILRMAINDILDKAIVGRKVHFFNKEIGRVVGEAIIFSKDRDIISFEPLQEYYRPNYDNLTIAKLRERGVNIKPDWESGYKNFCSGKTISKTDSEKISEIGTYLPDK